MKLKFHPCNGYNACRTITATNNVNIYMASEQCSNNNIINNIIINNKNNIIK